MLHLKCSLARKLQTLLFNSAVFLIFFALLLLVYWRLAAHYRAQNVLLLLGSWFFYGWWDERFLLLIGLSTLVDFLAGLGASGARPSDAIKKKALGWFILLGVIVTLVAPTHNWMFAPISMGLAGLVYFIAQRIDYLSGPVRRKSWLIFSLVTNLGLLATFKYFGFFTDSFADAMAVFGLQINAPLLHIILPVGISFYTFQTLSYTIDIYRKQMQPTERFVDFAAYVAFFPQLVAGPIERAKKLLPQFQTPRQWRVDQFQSGALLFVWGLYKKLVIADNLAPIVDMAFSDVANTEPTLMVVGIVAFAFQIYGDFSGYSDMARGLARMLGFELMLNFNLPYFSRTPSEFWRRWHISLSTWLKDYLYIPLGGNQKGRLKTYRNLMLTMVLGGLWHGAAWTFIAWGAFQGGILTLYRLAHIDRLIFSQNLRGMRRRLIHIFAWGLMSYLTLIGWTFFRADTIGHAFHAIALFNSAILSGEIFTQLPQLESAASLVLYISPLLLVQLVQYYRQELELLWKGFTAPSIAIRFVTLNLLFFVVCALVFLSAEAGQAFIYFDF